MNKDRNIIKGNKFADLKVKRFKLWYAVIDIKVKQMVDGESKTVSRSIVEQYYGTRSRAKRELEQLAKANNGKITHFNAYN